jgi:hypothetical protein
MGMDRRVTAFYDELEKIALSLGLSHFTQQRRGRRPMRVSTMLKKESPYVHPEDERQDQDKPEPRSFEIEGGKGYAEGGFGG